MRERARVGVVNRNIMTLEILLLVISILGIYEGARLSRTVLLFAD